MAIELTVDLLKQIFPRGNPAAIAAIVAKQHILEREGINHTRTRLATLFAHLNHESNGLTIFVENLNYSAARLTEVWPNRFPTIEKARPYAFNPEALANNVYSGRMGNNLPGYGWKFRGSGGPQLTGYDCFLAVEKYSGLPLTSKPELARDPANTPEISAGFWAWKQMNRYADTGNIKASTVPWNGGTNGLADRAAAFQRNLRILESAKGSPPTAAPPKEVLEAASANEARLRNAGLAGVVTSASVKTATNTAQPEKIIAKPETGLDWTTIVIGAGCVLIVIFGIGAIVRKKIQVTENWK